MTTEAHASGAATAQSPAPPGPRGRRARRRAAEAGAGEAAGDDPLADLLAVLPGPPPPRVVLIGRGGARIAAALHARGTGRIEIADLDRRGKLQAQESAGAAALRAALAAAGVPPATVARLGAGSAAAPAPLVLNLAGFGDGRPAAVLPGLLDRWLAPGGLLLADLRKGSGALPLLRARGEVRRLSQREENGRRVLRVVLTARPPVAAGPDGGAPARPAPAPWAETARSLAGPRGFFREGAEHGLLFVPRDPAVLVVAFDNLDIATEKRADRRPWGYGFIEKQGWSYLGITARGWTWFRDPWLLAEFAALRDGGFFDRFGRTAFYGASMGGYGAAAFAGFRPGADVVAIAPQSTLDRARVPWETRYARAWGRDFSGPAGDAAEASRAARRVVLLYDPYEPLDAAHAARFDAPNVMRLRAPLMGHRLGSSLLQMGILSPIVTAALDGTLTEADFFRALRARRSFPRYHKELFRRAVARGHTGLARRLARWVLTRGDSRYIRRALATL